MRLGYFGRKIWAVLWALPLSSALICALARPVEARRSGARAEAKKAAAKKAEAEGFLKEGMAQLAARELSGAAQKLSESYVEAPSLDGLYALAKLALAEGKTLQAQDLMRRYLADPLLEAAPDSAEQREAQRILSLPRPPSSLVEIQGARGTLIKLDDRPIGVLPFSAPMMAAPGEHTMEIVLGEDRLREKLRLTAGRFSEIRYNLSARSFLINVLPGLMIVIDAAALPAAPVDGRQLLRQALDEAVQKERYSPLSAPQDDDKEVCKDTDGCTLQQARKLQAEYVATVRVQKRGEEWQLAMELLDVEIGALAATAEKSCPGCAVDKLGAMLAGMFAPLLKQAIDRPRGKLRVTSDPTGAELSIDGRHAGMTPFEGLAFIGPHKLLFKRKRFHEAKADLEVKENQTGEARVALQDLPDPEPPPPCPLPPPPPICPPPPPPPPALAPPARLPTWRLATGLSTLAAGAVLIGFGAPALALEGQCADDPIDPTAVCKSLFHSRTPGAAMTGLGGGLVIAGALLLTLPTKRSGRR